MDLRCVAEDHTQLKKLVVLRKYDKLGGKKTKVARKCGVSRQFVQEQAEEHTGLTD